MTNTEGQIWEILQRRREDSHKGDYGTLTIVAGSSYYRGAAQLAVRGALRSGVGIVCLASIEEVIAASASSIPECTYLPLPKAENGIAVSARSVSSVLHRSIDAQAMLLGCGMTVCEDTASLVSGLLQRSKCQMVLDADALNVLADDPAQLRCAALPPIVTPHPGEMARLMATTAAQVAADPMQTALSFAAKYHCITVLKGHRTVVAAPDGRCTRNTTGNAGLACGGSGDVLAGMIASFSAQGIDPYLAAICGVYLHGLAADRCAARLSQTGMLPSDLLSDLCDIFREHGR